MKVIKRNKKDWNLKKAKKKIMKDNLKLKKEKQLTRKKLNFMKVLIKNKEIKDYKNKSKSSQ